MGQKQEGWKDKNSPEYSVSCAYGPALQSLWVLSSRSSEMQVLSAG